MLSAQLAESSNGAHKTGAQSLVAALHASSVPPEPAAGNDSRDAALARAALDVLAGCPDSPDASSHNLDSLLECCFLSVLFTQRLQLPSKTLSCKLHGTPVLSASSSPGSSETPHSASQSCPQSASGGGTLGPPKNRAVSGEVFSELS